MVSPVPPRYQVPENIPPSEPFPTYKQILNGVGAVLYFLFFLPVALIALIPSLLGGAVEAPKKDGKNGNGTFMGGFANVFRAMTSWMSAPLYQLVFNAGHPSAQFFVDTNTLPGTTIITARIHLTGDPDIVADIHAIEADLEKHLAIDGYLVNVEFVDAPTKGSVTIRVDTTVWSNYKAWNPHDDDRPGEEDVDQHDVYKIAHEIMHRPLGLGDEYNYQTHFNNKAMAWHQRLGSFVGRLVQPTLPEDAPTGIMDVSWKKPLRRHYEEILTSIS